MNDVNNHKERAYRPNCSEHSSQYSRGQSDSQNLLDEIIAELAKGNRLEFRGFGVFELREHAPRMAQNPKTLERIHVPAKRTVRFKAGRLMKQKLNRQDMETQVLVRK